MNFYFDKPNELNLHVIPEIKQVRPRHQLESFYQKGNAKFITSKSYKEPGIYLIEVSKMAHQWTNGPFFNSFNIFKNLPIHVVSAVKANRLRIVILSIVEGNNFITESWDGFKALTNIIRKLGLPKNSVLVVSGDVFVANEYAQWCKENKEEPFIEFIGGSEGPYSLISNERIANSIARDCENPYSYSSLNRAHRPHRTEHLFAIAKRGILKKGLVSGGLFFETEGIGTNRYVQTSKQVWNSILKSYYPRTVDIADLATNNPANDINLFIYENALLSVVTETFFEETGLFVTEKTWKPISVGSPQLVLGQPYLISYLKSKFNINIKFPGINHLYDDTTDHVERFLMFHESLISWCSTPLRVKRKLSIMWDEQLIENRRILHSIDFKKVVVDDIIESTKLYFQTRLTT